VATTPLEDVKVLDMSQVLAGPLAAMLLGDMGCDVIKVEPLGGEATRHSFGTAAPWGETPGYLSVNRNKRSIALDLKSERGREVLLGLAARSDVVIQNFRPGVAERLGLSYEQLTRANDRLIVCSISGFGATGPHAHRGGYDMMAQAMSGIMSVTGEADGAPCRCGVPVADIGTGLFAAVGILGALMSRQTTGRGCKVETNLYDSALAYAVWDSAQYWATGAVPRALGSAHQMNAPYQAYRCKDGYVTVGANNPKLWRRLCDALDHPEWDDDPRFASATERVTHMTALAREIEASIAGKTRDEVEALLERFDVPVGAVRTYDEVFDDAIRATDGMTLTAEYGGHAATFLGSALKVDGARLALRRRPPELGEHTEEVLCWLGLSAEEVGELRSLGVVGG
jgi:formyl-CoA transferase